MSVSNLSLVCQAKSELLFSDLFLSDFSIWQHIAGSRGAWHGELVGLCVAVPWGWKPAATPGEIHGRACQRVPLFFKVAWQFISIKVVKPKTKSQVSEDVLQVWWLGVTYKCPAWVMHCEEGQRQWRSRKKQIWGETPDFWWGNWQMFLVSPYNDIWFES